MKLIDFDKRKFTKNNLVEFQENSVDEMNNLFTLLMGNNVIPYEGVIILYNKVYNVEDPQIPEDNYHWEVSENQAYTIKNEEGVIYDYLTKDTKIRDLKWADYINEFRVYEHLLTINSTSSSGYNLGDLSIDRNRNFITINGSIYLTQENIKDKFHITQDLESSGKWIKMGIISNPLDIPSITSYTIGYGPSNINIVICIIGKTPFENTQENHPRTPQNIKEGDIYLYVGKIKSNTSESSLYKFNFNSQIAL